MSDALNTSTATTDQSGQRYLSLTTLLRALGVNGFLAFSLLVCGGFALLQHLGSYAMTVLGDLPESSERFAGVLQIIVTLLQIVVWIPIAPLLLIAVFLPLRVVWIHGQVRWSALIDELESAAKATLLIIQVTWRHILFLLVPVAGILILLHQLTLAQQPAEVLLLFKLAAVGFGGAMLWQAAAPLCAAPIAILTGAPPLAAVRECALVIRGAHRVRVLCGVAVVVTVTAGLYLGVSALRPTSIELGCILAAIAIPYWILWIAVARTCLIATVEYLERASAAHHHALGSSEISFGPYGFITTLPNGQPVTIQIQNLRLDPRR